MARITTRSLSKSYFSRGQWQLLVSKLVEHESIALCVCAGREGERAEGDGESPAGTQKEKEGKKVPQRKGRGG